MEVHLTPETQAKLDQMARGTGRRSDELLEDAVIGLFDDELAFTRETLDRRYDDLESGKVKARSPARKHSHGSGPGARAGARL